LDPNQLSQKKQERARTYGEAFFGFLDDRGAERFVGALAITGRLENIVKTPNKGSNPVSRGVTVDACEASVLQAKSRSAEKAALRPGLLQGAP